MISIAYSSNIHQDMANVYASILNNANIKANVIKVSNSTKWNDKVLYIGFINAIRKHPKNFIVVNTEPLTHNDVGNLVNILDKSLGILEYSHSNFDYYTQKNIDMKKVFYFPFGYHPGLCKFNSSNVDPRHKDIDVLFYGCLNDRRKRKIEQLKKKYKVYCPNKLVIGKERDALIRRSKIVLSIKFYEAASNDLFRLGYLISNKANIVCEKLKKDSPIYDELEKLGVAGTYEDLDRLIELNLNKDQSDIHKWFVENYEIKKFFPFNFIKEKLISIE